MLNCLRFRLIARFCQGLIALTNTHATTALAQNAALTSATFKPDTSSSGWISYTTFTNLGIYVPLKVNGHEAMALLWGGPSSIDKDFAASVGLDPSDAKQVTGVEVQIGGLTLNLIAKPDNLEAQSWAKILGQPQFFTLGREIFAQLAVEIDFDHHRIAFRDPATVTKPDGAAEVPLVEQGDERVMPASINGAPPVQFELELGNVIGPLMTTPAYADDHKLLAGHATSERLSGGRFVEPVVSIDHLNFAGVDFRQTPIAIIPESQLPTAPITGGIGLPLLARFHRIVIDYPHSRLYAIPNPAATRGAIPKDRIGLLLGHTASGNFEVAFVAPHSPAEAVGFKKGDTISLIDGKPRSAWSPTDLFGFDMAEAGTTHVLTMPDGSTRQLKAADFF